MALLCVRVLASYSGRPSSRTKRSAMARGNSGISARTLNELKERSIWVIGTSDDAPATLYQSDLTVPCALVLGAEGSGMRQLTRKTCDELIRIPMMGAVESLNVSVASGICLYEALRQRQG